MQRALLSWTLVFGLLLAGFGACVLALNSDVFSAHGFVRSYLEALERQDADEALDFDGVVVPAGASEDLLVDAALGDLSDIHLLNDVEAGDTHVVTYRYTLGGETRSTDFTVERTGTRLWFFPTWRFAISPMATLTATIDHDTRLVANGVDSVSGAHAVLVPGSFALDHESAYLQAAEVPVVVTEVGETVGARVEVTPSESFAPAATAAIAAYLDACVTQEVLKPTGCPMGTDVANRLNSAPVWSMVDYPTAVVEPTDTPGVWKTEPIHSIAHITAEVKSLFDGSVSSLNEDVPFSTGYRITIAGDDSLSVTAPA